MKITVLFILAILATTLCYAQSRDSSRATRALKTEDIKLLDAFNHIQRQYDTNIKIKGLIPDINVSLDKKNVTLKEAIVLTLKEAKIINYTFNINNHKHEVIINILPQGDKFHKSAKKYDGDVRHLRPINTNDLVQLDEYIKLDESKNDPIKPFTYEQIEDLLNTYQTKHVANNSQSMPFTNEQIIDLQTNYGTKISNDGSVIINSEETVSEKATLSTKYDKINEPLNNEQIQKLKNLYGDRISSDDNFDM